MKNILEVAMQGFWQFIGVLILVYIPFGFALQVIHKAIRAYTISKQGYPPPHCDGDGDAYKED